MTNDDAPKPPAETKPRPLNAKQIAFVDHYLATHPRNAKGAYLKVYGCSEASAEANGSRLLADARVQALIAEREEKIPDPFRMSHQRIHEETTILARSDLSHYQVDAEGRVSLAPGAPPNAMRAIKEIQITRRTIPQVEKPAIVEITTKIRLWDKPSMVRLSSQMKGMIKKSSELHLIPPGGPKPDDSPANTAAPAIVVEIVDAVDGKPVAAKSA